jgi:hypothetical protein
MSEGSSNLDSVRAFKHLLGAIRDGVSSVPENYRRRMHSLAEVIAVGEEVVQSKVFCFGGEFGYELLSWLPYLRYVATTKDVRLRTCSRPGTAALYSFATEHIEVPFTWRPDKHGSEEASQAFRRWFGDAAVFPTGIVKKKAQDFSIAGVQWHHQDIHSRLTAAHYKPLELVVGEAEFLPSGRRVAVINNKDFDNWAAEDKLLRESFDARDLERLRQALVSAGYFVVYHRFDEPVPEERFELRDDTIFRRPGSLDMRDLYRDNDARRVMELQLQLYRSAELAVCPQGGNSFLPIMSNTRAMILSKARARLIEYQDLARLYDTRVDVFTSTEAILDAVSLLNVSNSGPSMGR